jgi:hypothetical protein
MTDEYVAIASVANNDRHGRSVFLGPPALDCTIELPPGTLLYIRKGTAYDAAPDDDTARLNAMQANGWHAENAPAYGTWRVGKANQDGEPECRGATLRAAIDAAIDAARSKP